MLSKIEHRTARDVPLMVAANAASTVIHQTPARPFDTRLMRAKLAEDIPCRRALDVRAKYFKARFVGTPSCTYSTIPCSACFLQYLSARSPRKLSIGIFVQALCEQRLLMTSPVPFSEWCLQYAAVRLPTKLKLGPTVLGSWEKRRLRPITIPS